MIYARRDFVSVQQGLSAVSVVREVPAADHERAIIDDAVHRWLDGEPPLRFPRENPAEPRETIATTRIARTPVPYVEGRTQKYRLAERPATLADVLSAKLCTLNDDGLEYEADTMAPFEPEVRLAFADGSIAVMRARSADEIGPAVLTVEPTEDPIPDELADAIEKAGGAVTPEGLPVRVERVDGKAFLATEKAAGGKKPGPKAR